MRRDVRISGIKGRESLSNKDRKEFSRIISDAVLQSEEYKRAKVIMLYKAVKGEVNLEHLEKRAAEDGKKLAFPLCISRNEMIALSPHSDESWVRGSYGIMEPAADKSDIVEPDKIDLVLCPCTAFDEECGRMGMGGGYYDRYLPLCRSACVAAVAFDIQKAEKIPVEKWDVMMEKIFTEKKIYTKVIL